MVRARVILLAALASAVLAGAAGADDAQDRAYEFQMKRGRDLVGTANRVADPGAWKDAVEAFLAASRLRPSDPVPTMEAGLVQLRLGDGAGAARMLAATHERAPDSPEFHFLRGAVLQARGEYEDAGGEFRKCIEAGFREENCRDLFFRCRLGHGLRLVDEGKLEKALEVLGEAIALRPDHPLVSRAYLNVAAAHRRLRRFEEAEKVLRRCIEEFPSFAPAHGELGRLLTERGRYDEALKTLELSVRVDPNYAEGYLLKAVALTDRGRLPEAEEAFREYERRFPITAESEYRRGIFRQKNGEPARGVEALRHALALDPSRIRCHYWLALCFRDLGKEAEAKEAMARWEKASAELRKKHGGHGEDGGEEDDGAGDAGGEDAPRKPPEEPAGEVPPGGGESGR